MNYELIQLAPGSYDLLREGEIIASVVRNGTHSEKTYWTAELLENLPRRKRPAPFKEIEHRFETLAEICAWLGNPQIQLYRRNGVTAYGS